MATVIEKKSLNEIDKVRKITKFTRYFEKREKRKNTFLKYQDEIGAAIFFLSIFGMVGSSFLYIKGILSFWVVIPINAIFASFLHELEHDLIHGMYYKEKLMEKIMMYGVWIFRGNTPDPYYRKKIHLHHHKESGQFSDIEEQMIGNGMKYNFKRFLVMIDQQLSFFLNARRV
ncbi:MAG: fatty acid desaturase, partial [Leptospiraceae bacterium]|nr:fatty acid desaturase [Leptospiraceae bacterium]